MLIDALRGGPRSTGELADTIGLALPNAGQQLVVLRNAGLVKGYCVGTTAIYGHAEPAILEACDVVRDRRAPDRVPVRADHQRPARAGHPDSKG